MTNIREVFASNLKKFRHARGWSQAGLANKAGTSTNYIGMLETTLKFPSSEMIHKLAAALDIDPTALFHKDIDPAETMAHYQRAALIDMSEALNNSLAAFVAAKLQDLDPPRP